MNDNPNSAVAKATRSATWIGAGLILLGVLLLALPQQSGVALVTGVGILVLLAGGFRIFFLFLSPTWGSLLWRFLFGIAGVLAGFYLIFNPDIGLRVLTIVTIAYFIADGLTDILMGFRFPPGGGGFWMVSSGLLSILLGILMYRSWPISGEVAVPILIGIRLVYSGIVVLILSRGAKVIFDKLK